MYDKDKYIIHIRNLKYYLEKGLVLKQVHRCIKFNQSNWLKECIDFNTDKRKEATNDFDKDLFKLMNNAVYGKTMEDVRGHVDFELVDTPERPCNLPDGVTQDSAASAEPTPASSWVGRRSGCRQHESQAPT